MWKFSDAGASYQRMWSQPLNYNDIVTTPCISEFGTFTASNVHYNPDTLLTLLSLLQPTLLILTYRIPIRQLLIGVMEADRNHVPFQNLTDQDL